MTRLAIAVFVLLIGATFAAFFAAQRVKGEPPVAQVIGLERHFSPNGDDRKDVNRFRVRLREQGEVSIDVVDDDGDAVRRLADGATVGPDRPLRVAWDGRTDAGRTAPDGAYRVRVTLRREGRSVVPPRTMYVDTEPPRPRVREILPERIVGPAPGTMTFRLGAVSRRVPARVRIFRTDGGEPIEVASLRAPAGSRAVDWNGLVDGRPAPPGTYLVQVTTRDVAGNTGSTPVDVPPQPGEARGEQGFTVRAIAAQMPMRPVTAGDRLTVNVDSRRRPYRWRLRRAGRTNPALERRQRAGEPIRFKAPAGDSGLYLLELQAGAARTSVPVLVQSTERARMLVVVPSVTWSGTADVDEDFDGVPDTLDDARQITWPRVLPGGLPADLTERVAPLLVFLDRAGIRYDLTSDLDLMLTENPRASDRQGVLLAGSQRWITRTYARRLRRYVLDGGRVASFGIESLRRGLTVLRNDDRTAGRLVRPTQPSDQDPFGTRFEPPRRTPEPVTLSLIGGDPEFGLLVGLRRRAGRLPRARGVRAARGGPRRRARGARRRDGARGGGARRARGAAAAGAARARRYADRRRTDDAGRAARVVAAARRPPGRPDHAERRRPAARLGAAHPNGALGNVQALGAEAAALDPERLDALPQRPVAFVRRLRLGAEAQRGARGRQRVPVARPPGLRGRGVGVPQLGIGMVGDQRSRERVLLGREDHHDARMAGEPQAPGLDRCQAVADRGGEPRGGTVGHSRGVDRDDPGRGQQVLGALAQRELLELGREQQHAQRPAGALDTLRERGESEHAAAAPRHMAPGAPAVGAAGVGHGPVP